ncbi:MAG TPA: 2OG-Fe(II) oxygenase [Thermoanaerobaculia bacterium]|nr:2OG-Fe(II) oxygenase [Thermoanaerobaculia bacterium]
MITNIDPASLRPTFLSASPFPHIVIDRLFTEDALDVVLAEFPSPSEMRWQEFDSATERKLGFHYELSQINRRTQTFLWEMNSPPILSFLETLTGIEGLIPDPYFGGGGLHQILPGGFLDVHADFNWHPKLKLDRRLNVLVYLNKNWNDSFGGALELWSPGGRKADISITPAFNRTVIFATTDSSLHGHPAPLTCPAGMTRKSLSFYYYTNGRPESERSAPHDTIFYDREKSMDG